MTFFPHNPNLNQTQQTDAPGVNVTRGFLSRLTVTAANAVAADADGVHAAVTDDGSEQTITTSITSPAVPRNITATAGGTSTDVKAIQVTIAGTNYADEAITEDLPAFTVNTTGIVQGSKAFKTVTSITIPAHDGNGATTAIGWGDKLGLPDKLPANTVIMAAHDGTTEGTAPTVTVSSSAVESNTVDLDSALDGSQVDVWYIV